MSRDEDDEGFLSRWSRRKRVGEDDAPPAAPAVPAPEPEASPTPNPDEDEAAVLERLGLPDPDTLEQGADFSAFMRSAVPEAIRRRALRRLWRSNPTLAVLDGLNDYDDDFTGGFVKPGGLKTAYKVGRGFLERMTEDEEVPEATEDDFAARPAPVSSTLRPPVEDRPPAPETPDPDVDEVSVADEDIEDDAGLDHETRKETPVRRRMSFRFPNDQT